MAPKDEFGKLDTKVNKITALVNALIPQVNAVAPEVNALRPQVSDLTVQVKELTTQVRELAQRYTSKSKAFNWALGINVAALAAAVVGIPLMFLQWIEPHIENDQKINIAIEVGNELRQPMQDLNKMSERLAKTESSLSDLKPYIEDAIRHDFESATKLPTQALLNHLPAVNHLLNVAKEQSIRLDSSKVTQTATKLVEVSNTNLSAWDTVLHFLNYRSHFTTPPLQRTTPISGIKEPTNYDWPKLGRDDIPKFSVAGIAPMSEAAAFYGETDANASHTYGDAVIIVEGGSLYIDGLHLRHVVIRGTKIIYNGGPLTLDDVHFINCTFEMKPLKNTQSFASAILAPIDSTNFEGI